MIEAFAAIGAGSTLTLIGLVAWLVYRIVRSKDEQLAARELLDQEREELRRVRGELHTETAAHAVTRDELRKEKDLRATAESQRNEAHLKEREHVVTIIKSANIADAAHLVARILAAPLGVPEAVPAASRSEDPRDGLLDPFAVQPPPAP